jgi:hypothetical protein
MATAVFVKPIIKPARTTIARHADYLITHTIDFSRRLNRT